MQKSYLDVQIQYIENIISIVSRIISGTGTFGRVVLAQHRGTLDYFALKILTISEILRLKQVEHVRSEKAILNTINHPFIVKM